MSRMIKTVSALALVVGVAVGIVITRDLGHRAQAKEGGNASAAAAQEAGARDNVPRGRTPAPIVDGQYPAS